MIREAVALAHNGFREARRNRVTVVVAIFALALLLSSSLVTGVTVHTFERVLTNFGLGGMSLLLAVLAIFLSSGLLGREIERRTIFLVVSKPISRGQFLVSRLAGNMLTLTVLGLLMGLVFWSQLLLLGQEMKGHHVVAMVMLFFELLVISSVGFLMASFSTPMVSGFVTTSVYLAGHLSSDIYFLAQRSESVFLRRFGESVYYILPDLSRLNFRPRAAYEVASAPGELLVAAGYGLLYSLVLVSLAVLVFSRRDFR
jgi:Cu-processing system permease protein